MQTSDFATLLDDRRLRVALVRNLVVLTIATCGAIATVFILSANRTVETVSANAIESSTSSIEHELDAFFEPVKNQLRITLDWARLDQINLNDPEALNARFIPILTRHPQMSSMLIASTTGQEYMLLKKGETWVNRLSDPAARGQTRHWREYNDSGELLRSWEEELEYDSSTRPWFKRAFESSPNSVAWTDPYTFFTTKDPGITASGRIEPPGGDALVVAFDVMLLDISRFTTQLSPSPNGMVIVLDPDDKVLGLPRAAQFDSDEELKRKVFSAIDDLNVEGLTPSIPLDSEQIFEYIPDSSLWWGRVRPYTLENLSLKIGVFVPEADYIENRDRQRNTIVGISLIAVMLAIALAFFTIQKFRARVDSVLERVRQLGQYTLERQIGRGGMGEVYLAHHGMLRRPTAVKLIRPELTGPDAIQQFEKEVQSTCQLTHPNTIVIYDYGQTSEGVFYYAMEYLEGDTLLNILADCGKMPPRRTIHILQQVCASLSEAHALGFIHRDIKPGNIFVSKRGGQYDWVKVLDFGLVQHLDDETRESNLQGTPGYVGPEVFDGKVATARTDIYALGALGYAMLTGKPAFRAGSAAGIVQEQLKSPPPRPSKHVEIPEALDALIASCLSKDPEDRPESVDVLMDRLDECDLRPWTQREAQARWADFKHDQVDDDQDPISATALTVQLSKREPPSGGK